MAQTLKGGKGEGITVACAALGIGALKDAHFVAEIAVSESEHTAYAGSEIGSIGLELSCGQCLREALAGFETFINGIGLIAVGDDELIFKAADCSIDDEAGVFNLGNVKRLGENFTLFQGENSVAAVGASAHDKISGCSLFAVGSLADDDAAANIGIAVNKLCYIVYLVDIHYQLPRIFMMFAETSSAAWGSICHSACSITRFWRVSGVSPFSM